MLSSKNYHINAVLSMDFTSLLNQGESVSCYPIMSLQAIAKQSKIVDVSMLAKTVIPLC